MQKRTLKVAILAVLAVVLVLTFALPAFADSTWTDLPDTVTAKYGVTDNQVAAISEGFPGNLWKPFQPVTRAQFTKMAVATFGVNLVNPATASFTDVPKGSYYYQYIEGAKAAGLINGTTATTFSLNANITRQQAVAIVSRYVAKANGYTLATMYSATELDALLKHFGDAASIATDLKNEVAFAFDMGLTNGDAFGNFNPLANVTRIQGAAFLLRAKGLVPPAHWTPAKIELVSTDKTEGLIGQAYKATFQVTTADGHPAIGVLVDFDSLVADWYVGNVEPQAALTNNAGQVTINMISTEPGVQRISASVNGLGTIYTTRYWLALDEVYDVKGDTAQNNAGVEHTWGVRVVVFGPGPRSTSVSDWYNAIYTKVAFDPTNVNAIDGVDANDFFTFTDEPTTFWEDGWDISVENALALQGFKPRTLAGIDVHWSIYDQKDDPLTLLTNEAIVSVGNIIKVDGAAITPAKTAVGKTDADGLSTIVVYSEVTGKTLTQAIADYAGNPYPQELFDHGTFQKQSWWHNFDWDDQPTDAAFQTKTWIAHTIGGTTAGPIAPAYVAPNVGEEKILTLTLKDVYGNPVSGRAVEWYMQGTGFFQTDDSGDTSDPAVAANNKDFDTTDASGKATVFVKSYYPGEQIVHAKVRDKGTGGAEGTFTDYTAEVQWFDVNIVTFDDITTHTLLDYQPFKDIPAIPFYDQNEAVSANAVNGSHTFTANVYGLKLEYDPSVDEPDGQTSFIDSDAAGHSYDGILNSLDAAYFGGILMWPSDPNFVQLFQQKLKLIYQWKPGYLPEDLDGNGIIEACNSNGDDERGTMQVKINGEWLTLSFEGAYVNYDYNEDGFLEDFSGLPGIYLPLAGKTVTFSKANQTGANLTNLGAMFDGADTPSVGSFTPTSAVTDAAGKATVTVTSTVKGPETIKAVVDWAGNPHNGPQLLSAYAKKSWQAGTVGAASDVTIEIWIDGVKVATNKAGELASGDKAAWTVDPATNNLILNSAHVEVHVKDAYGNDLPDYEVVYLLEDITGWLGGTQNAANTYIPFAYLADLDPLNVLPFPEVAASQPYDQNGYAPDSNEPSPGSDPYAYMVGPGYDPSLDGVVPGYDSADHAAFFFNQWLGSEKPTYMGQAGIPKWWTRTPGFQFDDYSDFIDGVAFATNWPWTFIDPVEEYSGFDGVLEDAGAVAPLDIGLATDGAKAWTLDGYAHPSPALTNLVDTSVVIPNLLTGSNIDIQLADAGVGLANAFGIHVKSILRVMVYAPADGLVKEGSYIWSTQVHQVWETPVPTTITLTPATDYAVAGLEEQSVVATVKDQFGNVMPNIDVSFVSSALEGQLTNTQDWTVPGDGTITTDSAGQAAPPEWGQSSGDWGVEQVFAFIDADTDGIPDVGEVTSNPSVIQWIYMDDTGDPGNLVAATGGQQKVEAYAGDTQYGTPGNWNGMTLRAWLNPGGNVAGALASALYDSSIDNFISTNLHTWIDGEAFFVSAGTPTAVTKSNTDGIPNWVYDLVGNDD